MNNVEKIVIVGAGGFGREVFHLLNKNHFKVVGFLDPNTENEKPLPLPILGDDSLLPELKKNGIAHSVVVAIGDIAKREKISKEAIKSNLALPTIIHEDGTILTNNIGRGAIIYPGVVVMNDCTIGDGVLINSGVTLGHDVKIGNFCNINPGAHLAGGIQIGDEVFIGIGVSIKENIKIGNGSFVGAGSVVLEDVPEGALVYGVPAKIRNTVI